MKGRCGGAAPAKSFTPAPRPKLSDYRYIYLATVKI
jgi:hypothetical protein